MQTLREIFSSLDKLCDKWEPYFPVYETWFSRFRNQAPRILEIGVYKGGSAEMWLKYFGNGTTITGIDINPDCAQYQTDYLDIIIGDSGDLNFWMNKPQLLNRKFDIIIDDGGHHMDQQIFTLQRTWPMLNEGGVYLCEDTHTSYWDHWPNSGYGKASSFMEYSKGIIDGLNADHTTKGPDGETFQGPIIKRPLGNTVGGIHYYDSMVVLEKKTPLPFKRVFSKTPETMTPELISELSSDTILTFKT